MSIPYICMILEIDFLDSNYEAPSMPQGFVYQIIIFSTWGDSYYVGLNGIQIYDNYGNEIMLTTDSTSNYYPLLVYYKFICLKNVLEIKLGTIKMLFTILIFFYLIDVY